MNPGVVFWRENRSGSGKSRVVVVGCKCQSIVSRNNGRGRFVGCSEKSGGITILETLDGGLHIQLVAKSTSFASFSQKREILPTKNLFVSLMFSVYCHGLSECMLLFVGFVQRADCRIHDCRVARIDW